ncbi:IS1634 family transposase [Mycoplasmopsis verecunda]|uniref:IS1634 family transposase n=1 Tax=Mycoplasmopsis verecunda TaxID=171291 RepID=UPI00298C1B60|nr:IS1634 family transposase [Mycoplasmopsis verecunda]WPB54533.1 IS1634 family transposase [Mycoplasmopsis verecunda]
MESKAKLHIMKSKNKDKIYLSVCKTLGFGKGYKRIVGLGYLEELEKLNPNALDILKQNAKVIPIDSEKEYVKEQLINSLNNGYFENRLVNYGIQNLYSIIKELEIFNSLPKTKHKQLEQLLEYFISSRIIQADSIIQTFNKKMISSVKSSLKKVVFYNVLDLLDDYKVDILKRVNKVISEKTKREIELVFYDSSTVYFETFKRDGLRFPGYSKDGKIKEDQVVLGMATDSNGIPIHFELFKGNTMDASTMIPFIIKMTQTYDVKNITIIADRGMSSNRNIRFLEQLGIDFIISYRAKAGSNQFKEYIFNESDWIENGEFKYKEQEYASMWNKKRLNGHKRRRIVTFSEKELKKIKLTEMFLINNFIKKQNKNGVVKGEDLIGIKKYKFFKTNDSINFVLNYEKIEQDKKFDGIYVYETSRMDLSPEEIKNIYHKQWQIEENFRTLKAHLMLDQFMCETINIFEDTLYYVFLALVVLKYSLYKVNEYLHKYGVIDKFTNNRLIESIKSAVMVEELVNNQIVRKTFINKSSDNKSDYEIVNKALNNILCM